MVVMEVGVLNYNVFLNVRAMEGINEISPSLMEAL
jgi:hypothetical protein